ncbi:MAG: DNA-directed DNA polymerase II small subunit [Halobacteriaceae archaeon]
MPQETPVRIIEKITEHGYNADRDAVTLLSKAEDPDEAIQQIIETLPDDTLTIESEHVRRVITDTSISSGTNKTENQPTKPISTVETEGMSQTGSRNIDTSSQEVIIRNDITGNSTGTGEYADFVSLFHDRYERLSGILQSRVNHRPTDAIADMSGGSETALIGMINDIRSTANGNWIIELEDTNGTFPCLIMKDRDLSSTVDSLLLDEVVAISGTLSDDTEILFGDEVHFPDVPRNYQPATADRKVEAALISDIHIGSQEFLEDKWQTFTEWLHSEEASHIEYLLIAGDMVEGVGVYPDQDEELDIVNVYDQYRALNEYLKDVPAGMEIIMIPGNHDAVRLAEPQPGFDDRIRDILSPHDATIVGNPVSVDIEGVTILMYHGVSLDEIVAEIPDASYEQPAIAMQYLLQKRHVAPTFGGKMRIAPEKRDYLVIEDIPDVVHSGHVHKIGVDTYHNVRTINSGCWQSQTEFQRNVNIEPDPGYAVILDLETLEPTIRKFN